MAPSGYLENIDLKQWRYQMAVNVEGPLFLTQALLPKLHGGRVLNMSIYSSFKVLVGLGAYGMSKAALNMMTEYLKVELKKHEITVGIVLPGIVETNIQSQLAKDDCAEIIARNLEMKSSGKLLSPSVVAKFMSWLLFETKPEDFSQGVWDIYNKQHHSYWASGLNVPVL
jgi:NAD(P)-dependent dehydrogenase (short-subunit alcohol dehydrogenase family)